MLNRISLFLLLTLFFSQCVAPEEKNYEFKVDVRDEAYQQVMDYQDRRETDSLLLFFNHENPSLRYAAVQAFGSVQDEKALSELGRLLKNDPEEDVRMAAAFAIGQIGKEAGQAYLVEAFVTESDSTSAFPLNGVILEAIGRCGDEKMLSHISTVNRYKNEYTDLLRGQALGIYRYGVRDMVSPLGTAKVFEICEQSDIDVEVRIIAANYLGRAKNLDLLPYEQRLIKLIKRSTNPYETMALVLGAGKVPTDSVFMTLSGKYNTTTDYRVRNNIIRMLEKFTYPKAKVLAFEALKSTNIHTATAAANYFKNSGVAGETMRYYNLSQAENRWQVKVPLMVASIKHVAPYATKTKTYRSQKLIDLLETAEDVYEKRAILEGLGVFGRNYKYLMTAFSESKDPIMRSAIATAIVDIMKNENFAREVISPKAARAELNAFLQEAVQTGDVAVLAMIAELIQVKELGFKEAFPDYSFLETAKKGLSMPKDVETFNELEKALAFLKGITPSKDKKAAPEYNHPIDWSKLSAFDAGDKVMIRTDRGAIEVELFENEAPGTVLQFLASVKEGYYKGKSFHRVVPNFVVQGGCPRGDGWGGADFTIRSEFSSRRYNEEGYIGMASAGKDTESVQWFITHSPTMHLDGRYTIFGKVTEGMDVVHQLLVGDRIVSIDKK